MKRLKSVEFRKNKKQNIKRRKIEEIRVIVVVKLIIICLFSYQIVFKIFNFFSVNSI